VTDADPAFQITGKAARDLFCKPVLSPFCFNKCYGKAKQDQEAEQYGKEYFRGFPQN
jgi:hypothetical protein